jgi:hypothetical protein
MKDRDLFSAKGYSQSNRGRWCMIGRPTTLDRWRWLGASGAWRHGRSGRSSALHGYGAPLSVFSLSMEPVECEDLSKGFLYRRGLQSRTCGGKVQASTFSDGGGTLQGSAHDKVRPNGCGTEHRTPASDRWSSRSIARGMAMKGANKLPSIYMGFGLIISCVWRSLSPSSQIQLGFDISFDFIEISASDISVSVTFWRRVGDDRCWAAPRPRTSEAGAGSAGPAGLNSALGQIKTRKGVFISILF